MKDKQWIVIMYQGGFLEKERGCEPIDLQQSNFYPGEQFNVTVGQCIYSYYLESKAAEYNYYNANYIGCKQLQEIL